MAFITADRVRDTATTTGTGNFTVSGTAPTGFRTLSAVLAANDTFYYAIQHQTLNEWEVGLGTYSATANQFARTTVLSSSNAGSAVNFSAGTKDVFITLAANRTLQLGNTTSVIEYVIDGGGSAITTGSKGFLEIPFACTVNSWVIVADQSGSIVVDVKRATYSGFPTTSSIAGTEKPTLSSVQKNQDTALTSWSTIAAGDILEFNVDSVATVQRVTVSLKITRT